MRLVSMGSSNVARSRASCHVFIDFDGTIVPCDATDFLLERFALPEWKEVEQDWQAGRIGSRQCMAKQGSLLRGSADEIREALKEIEIDPGFVGFIKMCRANGIGTTIVSDGFDLVIDAMMKRYGIDIPFYANHLEPTGERTWRVTFPHSREDCSALAGNCKCTHAKGNRAMKVVVGDGRSDFCIAGRADLVFAKGKLLDLCRANGAFHLPFHDFFEVGERLERWLHSEPRSVVERAEAHPAV